MKRHVEFYLKVHDMDQDDICVNALCFDENDDPGMILNHFVTLQSMGLEVSLCADVWYTEEKENEE